MLDKLSWIIMQNLPFQPNLSKTAAGDSQLDSFALTREGITEKQIVQETSITVGALKQINLMLSQKDIPLIVAVYPWGHQLGENQWNGCRLSSSLENKKYPVTLQKTVVKTLSAEGIMAYDTTEVFERYKNTPLFFPCDVHWNEAGNYVYALALHEIITK